LRRIETQPTSVCSSISYLAYTTPGSSIRHTKFRIEIKKQNIERINKTNKTSECDFVDVF